MSTGKRLNQIILPFLCEPMKRCTVPEKMRMYNIYITLYNFNPSNLEPRQCYVQYRPLCTTKAYTAALGQGVDQMESD